MNIKKGVFLLGVLVSTQSHAISNYYIDNPFPMGSYINSVNHSFGEGEKYTNYKMSDFYSETDDVYCRELTCKEYVHKLIKEKQNSRCFDVSMSSKQERCVNRLLGVNYKKDFKFYEELEYYPDKDYINGEFVYVDNMSCYNYDVTYRITTRNMFKVNKDHCITDDPKTMKVAAQLKHIIRMPRIKPVKTKPKETYRPKTTKSKDTYPTNKRGQPYLHYNGKPHY